MKKSKLTLKQKGIIALSFLLVFVAVMAWHFGDTAHKPFWWTFWDIAGGLSIGVIVTVWAVGWKSEGKKRGGE